MQSDQNNLILTEAADFDLKHIFECGQCFRWDLQNDGSYLGIAFGKALKINCPSPGTLVLYETSPEDFHSIWKHYFDFERDYGRIKAVLSQDPIMKQAVGCGHGIRILRQELWETVVSFIISSSNNIPRIKKIIDALCKSFGNKIEYMGNIYYSFPPPEALAGCTLDELSVIRAGYRDKYILDAAKRFASGSLSPEHFQGLETPQAKKLLMEMNGVGSKVSDCILLFGLNRFDSFPVDVWIKRIMERLYFGSPQSNDKIERFALQKFGNLSGIAQQYLFFYAREQKNESFTLCPPTAKS